MRVEIREVENIKRKLMEEKVGALKKIKLTSLQLD